MPQVGSRTLNDSRTGAQKSWVAGLVAMERQTNCFSSGRRGETGAKENDGTGSRKVAGSWCFVLALHEEMDKLAKKAPSAELSDLATQRVNRVIGDAKELTAQYDRYIAELAEFVPVRLSAKSVPAKASSRSTQCLLAVICLLLLVGCSKGLPKSPQQPDDAFGRMKQQGSVRWTLSITEETGGVVSRSEGVWDFDSNETAITIQYPNSNRSTCRMLANKRAIFVRVPEPQLGRNQRRPWASAPMRNSLVPAGGFAFTHADPRLLLEAASKGLTTAEKLGSENIGGIPVTRYRVVADFGGGAATFDVWIDHEGLVRRIRDAREGESPPAPAQLGQAVVIEFYDYGRVADIAFPSKVDVLAYANPEAVFGFCFAQ